MIAQRKPEKVTATQWFELGDHPKVSLLLADKRIGWVPTKQGGLPVRRGQWVVEDEAGWISVLDGTEFSALYLEVAA